MQHQRRAGVGEEPAVAGVDVALRRQPLGQQDGVLVQLHVVVIDRRPVEFLADGGAVHQLPGADQLAVHEDGVVRRDQQIAVRHAVGEGVALDADRRHGLRTRMAGEIDAAMAEPVTVCGISWPSTRVMTCLPGRSFSTGSSPSGVRIIVPRA